MPAVTVSDSPTDIIGFAYRPGEFEAEASPEGNRRPDGNHPQYILIGSFLRLNHLMLNSNGTPRLLFSSQI